MTFCVSEKRVANKFELKFTSFLFSQNFSYNECGRVSYTSNLNSNVFLQIPGRSLLRTPHIQKLAPACFHSLSSPPVTGSSTTSLVPYRKVNTEVDKIDPAMPQSYSPFQPSNKSEYALARIDDLVNWCRKVCQFML